MTSPSPWPSPRDAYRLYLDSAAAAAASASAASFDDNGPALITAPAPPPVPAVLSTPRSAPGPAIPLFTESSPSTASTDDMLAQCIADTRQLLSELIRAAGTGNHVAQAAILPASELLGFQIAAQRSRAHPSLYSSAQARNPAMIAAPSLHSANVVADDQGKLRLQLAKRQRESAFFRSVLASPSPPQVLHTHASLVSRRLPPSLSLAPTVAHLPGIPDTVCDTTRRSTAAPNPKSAGRTRRMSCGAGRRLFPPPLMPRPNSPDPITSDTPPASNPHVIPPTLSTYQVSPSRYTSAGRLALHSSSPGAAPSLVLAHLLVPARHIPKRVLDQYCECIQSVHSASPNMTRVLRAIVCAGPLLSQSADQVASMVKRKWLTGLRALNHLVAWTLKPMVAVCVQPMAESKWADGLLAHLLDADREYAERMRAQVVVAVGVECDEHPDGLFSHSRVPNRDTSGFRLRERVALVVGEVEIPARIEYFSGNEQHDDMDVDGEMGKHIVPSLLASLPPPPPTLKLGTLNRPLHIDSDVHAIRHCALPARRLDPELTTQLNVGLDTGTTHVGLRSAIDVLLPLGFGNHVTHAQLEHLLTADTAVGDSVNRVVDRWVSVATETNFDGGVLNDWYTALTTEDNAGQVSLALLVGIEREMVSVQGKEIGYRYVLRERVAVVAASRTEASAAAETACGNQDDVQPTYVLVMSDYDSDDDMDVHVPEPIAASVSMDAGKVSIDLGCALVSQQSLVPQTLGKPPPITDSITQSKTIDQLQSASQPFLLSSDSGLPTPPITNHDSHIKHQEQEPSCPAARPRSPSELVTQDENKSSTASTSLVTMSTNVRAPSLPPSPPPLATLQALYLNATASHCPQPSTHPLPALAYRHLTLDPIETQYQPTNPPTSRSTQLVTCLPPQSLPPIMTLIPPRHLPAATTTAYLNLATRHFVQSLSVSSTAFSTPLTHRIMCLAVIRGPTRPFTLADVLRDTYLDEPAAVAMASAIEALGELHAMRPLQVEGGELVWDDDEVGKWIQSFGGKHVGVGVREVDPSVGQVGEDGQRRYVVCEWVCW